MTKFVIRYLFSAPTVMLSMWRIKPGTEPEHLYRNSIPKVWLALR